VVDHLIIVLEGVIPDLIANVRPRSQEPHILVVKTIAEEGTVEQNVQVPVELTSLYYLFIFEVDSDIRESQD
jgi:hypothetical protein